MAVEFGSNPLAAGLVMLLRFCTIESSSEDLEVRRKSELADTLLSVERKCRGAQGTNRTSEKCGVKAELWRKTG